MIVNSFFAVAETFSPYEDEFVVDENFEDNEETAKKGIFGKRVAHGILVSGLISAVLGNKLPGPGSIYMGQELKFLAPVFIGDTITAEVEIIELIPEKCRIKLNTVCKNQDGKVVISGTALIMNRG